MKRGIIVLVSLSVMMGFGYFVPSKFGIHHTTLTFEDAVRGEERERRLAAWSHVASSPGRTRARTTSRRARNAVTR